MNYFNVQEAAQEIHNEHQSLAAEHEKHRYKLTQ
jgi:hypothetical protein